MKMKMTACLLLAATLGSAAFADQTVPMSDRERIDTLIKQNLLLTEENSRLRAIAERPRTMEEVFATCMQAAKGQGAMAASSVGDNCSRILKK